MEKKVLDIINNNAIQQRNLMLIFCFVLSIVTISQTIYLSNSTTQTIIVPSRINQEYEINSWGTGSTDYLESMALVVVYNMYNVSQQSFEYNRRNILKITPPNKIGQMDKLLSRLNKPLKKKNISTVFRPKKISVQKNSHSVKVSGYLASYIGDKEVSRKEKTFSVKFKFQGSTLYLDDIKEIINE